MAYDKLIRLAQLIYEKTKKGEIKWEATPDGGTFQASLASYSILIKRSLSSMIPPNALLDPTYFILQICNEQGQVMEELTWGDGFAEMRDLFELARRGAMGVEKALDDLIGTLEASPQRK